MYELKLIDVEKSFKEKKAVQNINLSLKHGVYGLLGENGAGKTTLMRLICNILKPTQGSILCDGMEIGQMGGEYRRLLGYLPQDFGYYRDFSAHRFLNYMAALKAVPKEQSQKKIDELLEMAGLLGEKDKKLKTYSGGMIRRIGIAQALLNDPEILILDEPTAGLDPKERVRFRNMISSLGKERIVMLSTHIVSDVEYIADQIVIMRDGKMEQFGTRDEISGAVEGCVWKCLVSQEKAAALNRQYIVSNLRSAGEQVELRIVSEKRPTEDAVLQEVTLEDVYLFYAQGGGGRS